MTQFQLFGVEDAGPRPLPVPDDAVQFPDLYRGLPLGVYDALRTFEHNKFLYLSRHLARTERSMVLLGWNYTLDRARLLRALHGIVTAAEWPPESGPEMRVRFDILAAPAEALGTTSRELIAIQPFTPPPAALYAQGVAVDFAPGLARANPLAKTADFAAARPVTSGLMRLDGEEPTTDNGPLTTEEDPAVGRGLPSAVPYEYLLLDDHSRILEGTGTNFWAVRDGVVYTAGDQVLEGVTREILLKLIPELGIPLRLEAVERQEIGSLDEAALSGSSRAFLPVVEIAGQPVGDGRPGPISGRILAAYNTFVAENIRPAI
jgi:branched-subunit amino acid aminotransferase/4-amino-4-deoxychorismate lyase